MKKLFEEPRIDVVEYSVLDVISVSPPEDGTTDGGETGPVEGGL